MFTQRQTYLHNALFPAVAVLLLLATVGQSAVLTDNLLTTAAPLSDSALTTQLNNSSMEEPRVQRTHKSCGSEHENYCENGGECMYPQDSDKPSCICKSPYSGARCLFYDPSKPTRSLPEIEQLIGIIFGVVMVVLILAIIIYCIAYRRCVKSAPLIKSAPSETSV